MEVDKPRQSKAVAIVLSISVMVAQVALADAAQAHVWAQRKKTIELALLPGPSGSLTSLPPYPSKPKQLPAAILDQQIKKWIKNRENNALKEVLKSVPAIYGSVRDVAITQDNPSGKIVIHIQDVHRNQEAQRNIGAAVQDLIRQNKIDLVALEAAFGTIDLAAYRRIPHPDAVQRVADYLLRENKISGPVHAGLILPLRTGQGLPPFVGVDDSSAYRANVDAVKAAYPIKAEWKKKIAEFKQVLENQKRTVFNSRLLAFDIKITAVWNGGMQLGDYAEQLASYAQTVPLPVAMFLEALTLESSLDFHRFEHERTALLNQLLNKINEPQTASLMDMSAAFRSGRISHADFYQYLEKMCKKRGIDLRRYPAVYGYIQYVLLSDSIDVERLNEALSKLKSGIYRDLTRTNAEKALIEESHRLDLLGKLVDFSLTSREWEDYTGEKSKLKFPNLSGVSNPKRRLESLPPLRPFETFYSIARKRDELMVHNLLSAMDRESADVAVLVTGGFHSQGIKKRLKREGVSIVTWTPLLTKIDSDSGTRYLSVFARQKTPLDKLLAGQKLFLAFRPLIILASFKKLVLLSLDRSRHAVRRFGSVVWHMVTHPKTGRILSVWVAPAALSAAGLLSVLSEESFFYRPLPFVMNLIIGMTFLSSTSSPMLQSLHYRIHANLAPLSSFLFWKTVWRRMRGEPREELTRESAERILDDLESPHLLTRRRARRRARFFLRRLDKVKGVIFDVGGVLVRQDKDTDEKLFHQTYRRLSLEGTIGRDELKRLYKTYGTSWAYHANRTNEISFERFVDLFNQGYMSPRGIAPLSVRDFSSLFRHTFTEIPGAEKIVLGIQDQFQIGILSDRHPPANGYSEDDEVGKPIRRQYGANFLQDLGDRNVLSYEIGRLKPHPQAFDVAFSRMNLDFDEVVFVDDKSELTRSARRLGLLTTTITGSQPTVNQSFLLNELLTGEWRARVREKMSDDNTANTDAGAMFKTDDHLATDHVKGGLVSDHNGFSSRQQLHDYVRLFPLAENHAHFGSSVPHELTWKYALDRTDLDWSEVNAVLSRAFAKSVDLGSILEQARSAQAADPPNISAVSALRQEFDGLTRLRPEAQVDLARFTAVNQPGRLVYKGAPDLIQKLARHVALEHHKNGVRVLMQRASFPVHEDESILSNLILEKASAIRDGFLEAESTVNQNRRGDDVGLDARLIFTAERHLPMDVLLKQARAFVRVLNEHPELREFLVGIDVADLESAKSPAEFIPFFEILNNHNQSRRSRNKPPLAFTYHAGEDFKHVSVESGIRHVNDALDLGVDGVGHGLVLGVNPVRFLGRTKQEPLYERIAQIYYDLRNAAFDSDSLKSVGLHIDQDGLWKELNGYAGRHSSIENNIIPNIKTLLESENLNINLQSDLYRSIYQLRDFIPDVHIEVRYQQSDHLEDLRKRQDYVLNKFIERTVMIETSPTVNVLIGPIKNYFEHPLKRFISYRYNGPDKALRGRNLITSINTDNPSILGITLLSEYVEIGWAFNLTHTEIRRLVLNGIRHRLSHYPLRYADQLAVAFGTEELSLFKNDFYRRWIAGSESIPFGVLSLGLPLLGLFYALGFYSGEFNAFRTIIIFPLFLMGLWINKPVFIALHRKPKGNESTFQSWLQKKEYAVDQLRLVFYSAFAVLTVLGKAFGWDMWAPLLLAGIILVTAHYFNDWLVQWNEKHPNESHPLLESVARGFETWFGVKLGTAALSLLNDGTDGEDHGDIHRELAVYHNRPLKGISLNQRGRIQDAIHFLQRDHPRKTAQQVLRVKNSNRMMKEPNLFPFRLFIHGWLVRDVGFSNILQDLFTPPDDFIDRFQQSLLKEATNWLSEKGVEVGVRLLDLEFDVYRLSTDPVRYDIHLRFNPSFLNWLRSDYDVIKPDDFQRLLPGLLKDLPGIAKESQPFEADPAGVDRAPFYEDAWSKQWPDRRPSQDDEDFDRQLMAHFDQINQVLSRINIDSDRSDAVSSRDIQAYFIEVNKLAALIGAEINRNPSDQRTWSLQDLHDCLYVDFMQLNADGLLEVGWLGGLSGREIQAVQVQSFEIYEEADGHVFAAVVHDPKGHFLQTKARIWGDKGILLNAQIIEMVIKEQRALNRVYQAVISAYPFLIPILSFKKTLNVDEAVEFEKQAVLVEEWIHLRQVQRYERNIKALRGERSVKPVDVIQSIFGVQINIMVFRMAVLMLSDRFKKRELMPDQFTELLAETHVNLSMLLTAPNSALQQYILADFVLHFFFTAHFNDSGPFTNTQHASLIALSTLTRSIFPNTNFGHSVEPLSLIAELVVKDPADLLKESRNLVQDSAPFGEEEPPGDLIETLVPELEGEGLTLTYDTVLESNDDYRPRFELALKALLTVVREFKSADRRRIGAHFNWIFYEHHFRPPVAVSHVVDNASAPANGEFVVSIDLRQMQSASGAEWTQRKIEDVLREAIQQGFNRPAAANDKIRLAQTFRPHTQCVTWEFSDHFWQQKDPYMRAMGRDYTIKIGGSPDENRRLIAATAEKYLEQLKAAVDMENKIPGQEMEPLYYVEVGAASVKHAKYFIEELARLARERNLSSLLKHTMYLLTDFSPAILKEARKNLGYVYKGVEIGYLEVDAENPYEALQRDYKGRILQYHATNVMGGLPTDEIVKRNNEYYRVLTRAALPRMRLKRIAATYDAFGITEQALQRDLQSLQKTGIPRFLAHHQKLFRDAAGHQDGYESHEGFEYDGDYEFYWFWHELWMGLELEERWERIENIEAYDFLNDANDPAAPKFPKPGPALKKLIGPVNGAIRFQLSNHAVRGLLQIQNLLHVKGTIDVVDIITKNPADYQVRFRGPVKYDGSQANFLNWPLMQALLNDYYPSSDHVLTSLKIYGERPQRRLLEIYAGKEPHLVYDPDTYRVVQAAYQNQTGHILGDDIAVGLDMFALEEGERWVLRPGMTYGTNDTFWTVLASRQSAYKGGRPHEATADLGLIRGVDGRDRTIQPNIPVPAIFPLLGRILWIWDDDMRQTVVIVSNVVVSHGGKQKRIVAVKTHMNVDPNLTVGDVLKQGDLAGTMEAAWRPNSPVAIHLHWAMALLDEDLVDEKAGMTRGAEPAETIPYATLHQWAANGKIQYLNALRFLTPDQRQARFVEGMEAKPGLDLLLLSQPDRETRLALRAEVGRVSVGIKMISPPDPGKAQIVFDRQKRGTAVLIKGGLDEWSAIVRRPGSVMPDIVKKGAGADELIAFLIDQEYLQRGENQSFEKLRTSDGPAQIQIVEKLDQEGLLTSEIVLYVLSAPEFFLRNKAVDAASFWLSIPAAALIQHLVRPWASFVIHGWPVVRENAFPEIGFQQKREALLLILKQILGVTEITSRRDYKFNSRQLVGFELERNLAQWTAGSEKRLRALVNTFSTNPILYGLSIYDELTLLDILRLVILQNRYDTYHQVDDPPMTDGMGDAVNHITAFADFSGDPIKNQVQKIIYADRDGAIGNDDQIRQPKSRRVTAVVAVFHSVLSIWLLLNMGIFLSLLPAVFATGAILELIMFEAGRLNTGAYSPIDAFDDLGPPSKPWRIAENRIDHHGNLVIDSADTEILTGLPDFIQSYLAKRELLPLQKIRFIGDWFIHFFIDPVLLLAVLITRQPFLLPLEPKEQFEEPAFFSTHGNTAVVSVLDPPQTEADRGKRTVDIINTDISGRAAHLAVGHTFIRFPDIRNRQDLAREIRHLNRPFRHNYLVVTQEQKDLIHRMEWTPRHVHLIMDNQMGLEKMRTGIKMRNDADIIVSIDSGFQDQLAGSKLLGFLGALQERKNPKDKISVISYVTRGFLWFIILTRIPLRQLMQRKLDLKTQLLTLISA